MAVRIISALIALPLLLIIVILGGMPLKIATMLLSVIGMSELYKAFFGKHMKLHYFGYLGAVIYVWFLDSFNPTCFIVVLTLFILMIFIYLVLFFKETNIIDVLITIFGFFYVPFLLSNIYFIREGAHGIYFVWLVFISAWACDTGAYFVGVKFGKRKLIPHLSPKKTVEGSIGGVLLATLVGLIYGYVIRSIIPDFEDFNIILGCVIISLVGSIFAQFGDLTASSIKRYTKIKDFGKVMPGHGGVLDRFDSVLFTAPVIYITIMLLR